MQKKPLPTLPEGVTQAREGITRCPACHAEVIEGWTPTGMVWWLSPVLGERHVCHTAAHTREEDVYV